MEESSWFCIEVLYASSVARRSSTRTGLAKAETRPTVIVVNKKLLSVLKMQRESQHDRWMVMQGPHRRPITVWFLDASLQDMPVPVWPSGEHGFEWLQMASDCFFRPVPVLCTLVAYRLEG